MIYRLILLLLLFTSCSKSEHEINLNISEITIEALPDEIIYFNKSNLNQYNDVFILAGIAEHECYNLTWQERHLVMEAVWNRVTENFNNNGNSLIKQLLAPKQFTGLFKYNPKQFCFDPNNKRHLENYQMAKQIVQQHQRLADRCIYYWAGVCDKFTSHYRAIYPRRLLGFNTVQIFA